MPGAIDNHTSPITNHPASPGPAGIILPMPSQHASVGPWEIVLQDVETPVGLLVSAVRVWGDGATFETEPFRYAMEGEAEVEALILAPHLEAFLRQRVPDNVQEISLELVAGKVLVKAVVRVILPVSATAVCTLRLEEGKRLFVDLESAEALGAGVKSLVQKQLDAINPVLDASTFPFEVTLDEVRVEEGRVIALGRAVPPPPPAQ